MLIQNAQNIIHHTFCMLLELVALVWEIISPNLLFQKVFLFKLNLNVPIVNE